MAEVSTNVAQKGGTVKWGTDSATTYGMIQSINVGAGALTKEYKDFEGTTKTLVVYDKHNTVNLSAICLASTVLPEIGDTVNITVGGTTYAIIVQSASLDWANEEATRISISGRTYPGITDAAQS